MADLLDLLQSQLGDSALNVIAQQIGGNTNQTSAAVATALPLIIQQLNKNASNEQGASSLFNAVARDHDGSVLEDVAGFVGNFQNGPGAGILKHLFGQRRSNMENAVSNSSGLNTQATSQLMQILAPLVMGQLGKQKKQASLDVGGLANLLNTNVAQQQKKAPEAASFLSRLIDKDGDGNINDDLTNMGIKALGNLFRKR